MLKVKIIVVTLLVGLMLTGSAYATTADLRAAALGGGTVINAWAFEGAATETAAGSGVWTLPALAGGIRLVEHNTNHGAVPPRTHIDYDAPGFDYTSTGASTYQNVTDGDFGHGDGFVTFDDDGMIAPPTTFTWEVVLQTGEVPISGGTWNLGYVIAHRPGSPRGYFLWQGTSTSASGDSFTSLTGDWIAGEATVVSAPLPENNWYYMAGTYVVNTGDGSSQVDLYYADLTAGDIALTHTSFANPKAYDYNVPGPFGIGERFDSSGESFPGVLDEMYFHEVALDAATLQVHLDQLLIPEPATMSLLIVGGLGLIARRRRS